MVDSKGSRQLDEGNRDYRSTMVSEEWTQARTGANKVRSSTDMPNRSAGVVRDSEHYLMSDMLADAHEPIAIIDLVQQVVPISTRALNGDTWGDYRWQDYKEDYEHVERKQWSEILGDISSVEDQLRREQQAHPKARLRLLVEGVATSATSYTKEPLARGTVVWKAAKTGRQILIPSRTFPQSIQMVYAWLDQVNQFIEVVHTSDHVGTAKMLVALYKAAQESNHATFRRHLNTMDFNPNPQVTMLMAIGHGIGIGPTKAELIIKKYGTLYAVLTADPKELQLVDGMGVKLAQTLLRKAGRLDV